MTDNREGNTSSISESGGAIEPKLQASEGSAPIRVRCGDCLYFVRDGRCGWTSSTEGQKKHPFEHAPFWVWSDCYSDREQVSVNATSLCPTFESRPSTATPAIGPASAPEDQS